MSEPQRLIFCHCEKNGGTTLIRLFRSMLGIRHVDLIPVDISKNEATIEDLNATLTAAPFAVTIAGHSLKPHVEYGLPKFTLLRDPVARYLSEFKHDSERRGFEGSLDDWMELRSRWNYQTKFTAGVRDLSQAKKVLENDLAFFGFTDRYDEFLRLVAIHLGMAAFSKASSSAKNTSKTKLELTEAQRARAEERNSLDLELISFARELYRERLPDWLARSTAEQQSFPGFGEYGNILLRNLWYKPRLGMMPFARHMLPVNAVNAKEAEALGLASFD